MSGPALSSDQDAALLAHARAHLLETHPAADAAAVDAFLHSAAFTHLAGGFHKVLEAALAAFIAQPGQDQAPLIAQDLPQPLPFKDLGLTEAPEATAAPAEPAPPPATFLRDVGFRLPEALAGQPYRQPLEAVPVSEDKVCFCRLSTGPGLELDVEKATGVVTGTPATAGDHALTVTYHYASEPGQERHAALTLTVRSGAAAN
jgi:hypothetical protein